MGYAKVDWIGCEVCDATAVDIHHIDPRGLGGSKEKDYIENLMALCRMCHLDAEEKKLGKEYLKTIHYQILANRT